MKKIILILQVSYNIIINLGWYYSTIAIIYLFIYIYFFTMARPSNRLFLCLDLKYSIL